MNWLTDNAPRVVNSPGPLQAPRHRHSKSRSPPTWSSSTGTERTGPRLEKPPSLKKKTQVIIQKKDQMFLVHQEHNFHHPSCWLVHFHDEHLLKTLGTSEVIHFYIMKPQVLR